MIGWSRWYKKIIAIKVKDKMLGYHTKSLTFNQFARRYRKDRPFRYEVFRYKDRYFLSRKEAKKQYGDEVWFLYGRYLYNQGQHGVKATRR